VPFGGAAAVLAAAVASPGLEVVAAPTKEEEEPAGALRQGRPFDRWEEVMGYRQQ